MLSDEVSKLRLVVCFAFCLEKNLEIHSDFIRFIRLSLSSTTIESSKIRYLRQPFSCLAWSSWLLRKRCFIPYMWRWVALGFDPLSATIDEFWRVWIGQDMRLRSLFPCSWRTRLLHGDSLLNIKIGPVNSVSLRIVNIVILVWWDQVLNLACLIFWHQKV